ncbi:MAG: hypothetical protein HC817_12925 [Saprospiraceae bacterium]|nr:hypothetical protein [Saprospiraceae bacterium]
MKKLFSALFALFTLSFTACFDITEEITVAKNGSGQYVNIIDASKLAEQMTLFAAFDTTGEMIPRMKYSLDSTFSTTWDGYRTVAGINNVKVDTSTPYVYKLTMDFKDMTALNAALNKGKTTEAQDAYIWEKGKLTRKDLALNLGELGAEMGDESQKEMLKGFLKDMSYKIIFHLPESIKKSSNEAATVSADKKTVTMDMNMLDIMDKKVKLGNEITY